PAADVLTLYKFKLTAIADGLRQAIEAEPPPETPRSGPKFLRLLYWNPREALWRIKVSPIEVKDLGREFFSKLRMSALTSATLSSGANPTFVTDRVGIELS